MTEIFFKGDIGTQMCRQGEHHGKMKAAIKVTRLDIKQHQVHQQPPEVRGGKPGAADPCPADTLTLDFHPPERRQAETWSRPRSMRSWVRTAEPAPRPSPSSSGRAVCSSSGWTATLPSCCSMETEAWQPEGGLLETEPFLMSRGGATSVEFLYAKAASPGPGRSAFVTLGIIAVQECIHF